MTISTDYLRKLPVILITMAGLLVSSLTVAGSDNGNGVGNGNAFGVGNGNAFGVGNGNGVGNAYGVGNGNADGIGTGSQNAKPQGKAIGLVNRLNGGTIGFGNGNGNGNGNNNGQGNASDGLKARIVTNQDIVYSGELLEVGVHFARGAHVITDGLADAYLVIIAPPGPEEGTGAPVAKPVPVVVPLNQELTDIADTEDGNPANRKLFEVPAVDTTEIPAGTYQLALILTSPGGDPLILDQWFNGFLGLLHIRGLTLSDEAVPADADGDGMMDCDADIDGMTCDDS